MLLDAKPPKPPTGIRKYIPIWALVLIIAIAGAAAFYSLVDLPEELAVEHFLRAVQQGRYQLAYKLWHPSSAYAYSDFMSDWGPKGDYGKIRTFKILGSRSKGTEIVIVTVRINGEDPPLHLVVDRQNKEISYSPFS